MHYSVCISGCNHMITRKQNKQSADMVQDESQVDHLSNKYTVDLEFRNIIKYNPVQREKIRSCFLFFLVFFEIGWKQIC